MFSEQQVYDVKSTDSIRAICTRRPEIGSICIIICVALFLIFLTNRTFWSKIHSYLADYPAAIVALYVGMAALFVAALTIFSVKYIIKPFLILMIFAAAIGSWFADQFGVVIDSDMVRNAVQTTPAEAQHLLTPGLVLHMLLFAFVPIAFLLWVRIKHRPIIEKTTRNLGVIAVCLIVFAGVFFSYSKAYTTAIRQHKDIVKSLNPVTAIAGSAKFLMQTGAETSIVVNPLGRDAKIQVAADGATKPRVTIIVAGETARAQNFSLGSYTRATNPELAKQDIVYFPHTTSCGTATATSIPCMFSIFTRSTYSHRKGLENETLLDVLAHAGADVAWWDNNTGSKGVADRVQYIDLVKTQDGRFCAMGECQDGIFFDRLDAWLDNVKKDSVLVLHTMGSHGPTYYQRYPGEFRRFTPDCQTAELANCKDEEIVNAYDNTILYTDHVLSTVIEKLKARSGKLETAMVYMSDHGESLGENGLYLHGTPYMLAPEFQTHVPFLVWLDPAFSRSMGLDRACLTGTASEERSHDNLFHSVISMMNIKTDIYDPKLDIFATCRNGQSS
ncbi:sulfatase [Rhizobium sp. 58]|nr:sulfatase [Rhizobium sp. 58]